MRDAKRCCWQSVSRHMAGALALSCILSGSACRGDDLGSTRFGGSVERGEQVVRTYGCAACHVVPGISQPRGSVGPPLTAFAERSFIAGVLPNTPENLTRWIVDPVAIDPKTAMPSLGLNEAQAQDVTAYLFTLD
jgi:cytochrome c